MTDDFWEWLPKAYGDVGDEPIFTKYNMEIAFAAGAEAEAKRMWQGLTDEERKSIREWQRIQEELGPVWAPMMWYLYEEIETKLKEKNT